MELRPSYPNAPPCSRLALALCLLEYLGGFDIVVMQKDLDIGLFAHRAIYLKLPPDGDPEYLLSAVKSGSVLYSIQRNPGLRGRNLYITSE